MAANVLRSDPDAHRVEVTSRCQPTSKASNPWNSIGEPRVKIPPTSPICSPLGCFCCSALASRPNHTIRVVHGAPSSHSRVRCPPRRVYAAMCGDSSGREHHQPHVGRWHFLPLNKGGLGIRSVVRSKATAFWSSWSDGFERDPATAPPSG